MKNKISHKELLTFSNLTNLEWQFVDLDINKEEGLKLERVNSKSIILKDLLKPESFVRGYKDPKKKLEPIYEYSEGEKGLEEMREAAGIGMEYLELYNKDKTNEEVKFLNDWEVVYAVDNYKLATEYVDQIVQDRRKELEKELEYLKENKEKVLEKTIKKALFLTFSEEVKKPVEKDNAINIMKYKQQEKFKILMGQDFELEDFEDFIDEQKISLEIEDENGKVEIIKNDFLAGIYGKDYKGDVLKCIDDGIEEKKEIITELEKDFYLDRSEVKNSGKNKLFLEAGIKFIDGTYKLVTYSSSKIKSFKESIMYPIQWTT